MQTRHAWIDATMSLFKPPCAVVWVGPGDVTVGKEVGSGAAKVAGIAAVVKLEGLAVAVASHEDGEGMGKGVRLGGGHGGMLEVEG